MIGYSRDSLKPIDSSANETVQDRDEKGKGSGRCSIARAHSKRSIHLVDLQITNLPYFS